MRTTKEVYDLDPKQFLTMRYPDVLNLKKVHLKIKEREAAEGIRDLGLSPGNDVAYAKLLASLKLAQDDLKWVQFLLDEIN